MFLKPNPPEFLVDDFNEFDFCYGAANKVLNNCKDLTKI